VVTVGCILLHVTNGWIIQKAFEGNIIFYIEKQKKEVFMMTEHI
jgi:hypothetical protein